MEPKKKNTGWPPRVQVGSPEYCVQVPGAPLVGRVVPEGVSVGHPAEIATTAKAPAKTRPITQPRMTEFRYAVFQRSVVLRRAKASRKTATRSTMTRTG